MGLRTRLIGSTLLTLLGLHAGWVGASPSVVSREEMQVFLNQPGNSVVSMDWQRNYQAKPVQWQGVVYRVQTTGDPASIEVLLKVIPSRRLYDTVLTIPSDHPWAKTLRAGQSISFQGIVTGAIDTTLLKEVHVELYNPELSTQKRP